ncbi:hypothetical protein ERJ75_000525100 [Trypanosoma vivax]|nr:hypothetical protein ERJ75_000525100 [Trypanosoma vivax]
MDEPRRERLGKGREPERGRAAAQDNGLDLTGGDEDFAKEVQGNLARETTRHKAPARCFCERSATTIEEVCFVGACLSHGLLRRNILFLRGGSNWRHSHDRLDEQNEEQRVVCAFCCIGCFCGNMVGRWGKESVQTASTGQEGKLGIEAGEALASGQKKEAVRGIDTNEKIAVREE